MDWENNRFTKNLVFNHDKSWWTCGNHLDMFYKTGVTIKKDVKGWKESSTDLRDYLEILSSVLQFNQFENRDGKKNVVGVMYSGGRNSTYLVLKNILEGKYVLPIYCVVNMDFEELIWLKNLELLQAEYGHILKPIRIDASFCFGMGTHWSNGHITRVFQNMIPYYLYEDVYDMLSEIQFGYCENDEFNQKLPAFESLRESLSNITGAKVPKLTTPLIKFDKDYIHRRLGMYSLNLCYTCTNLTTRLSINKRKGWILYGIEECGKETCKYCNDNHRRGEHGRNIVIGLSYGRKPINKDKLRSMGILERVPGTD